MKADLIQRVVLQPAEKLGNAIDLIIVTTVWKRQQFHKELAQPCLRELFIVRSLDLNPRLQTDKRGARSSERSRHVPSWPATRNSMVGYASGLAFGARGLPSHKNASPGCFRDYRLRFAFLAKVRQLQGHTGKTFLTRIEQLIDEVCFDADGPVQKMGRTSRRMLVPDGSRGRSYPDRLLNDEQKAVTGVADLGHRRG